MCTTASVVAQNLWFEVIANVAVQGTYYGYIILLHAITSIVNIALAFAS